MNSTLKSIKLCSLADEACFTTFASFPIISKDNKKGVSEKVDRLSLRRLVCTVNITAVPTKVGWHLDLTNLEVQKKNVK